MWVLPFFVKNALVLTLNSRVPATSTIAHALASVQVAEPLRQKQLFRSYPEVDTYLLKKFTNGQAIAGLDFSISRHSQASSTNTMQYAENLYAKSCKVADVYDESTLNGILVCGVDSAICHCLSNYWVSKPEANLTNIAFKALLLLAIQKGSAKLPHAGSPNAPTRQLGKNCWNNKTTNNLDTRSTTPPSRSS